MTTNHLIGLISSICLGLVILWTLLRKEKKTDYSKSVDCIEGAGQQLMQKPFTYPMINWGWDKKVQTKEEYENRPSDTDLTTHSKVLQDIKKVEKDSDESRFVNQMSRPEIRQVDLERKKDL